jgi:hypothetical protein
MLLVDHGASTPCPTASSHDALHHLAHREAADAV